MKPSSLGGCVSVLRADSVYMELNCQRYADICPMYYMQRYIIWREPIYRGNIGISPRYTGFALAIFDWAFIGKLVAVVVVIGLFFFDLTKESLCRHNGVRAVSSSSSRSAKRGRGWLWTDRHYARRSTRLYYRYYCYCLLR